MTRAELRNHLVRLRACSESLEWFDATPGEPADMWAMCPRIAWLYRFAVYAGVDARSIMLAACDCARLAGSDGDPYALRAVETAEAWTRGEATLDQVRAAAADAAASAAASAADTAADAATAAAFAAAAAAADAAACAAAYAAAYAVAYLRQETQRACTDLVRARIPWSLVEAALEATR